MTNPDSSTRVTTKITQTATVLDWSEVWYKLRVSWVAKELYADSQVTGAERDTMMNEFMDVFMGDPAQSTFTVNSSGVPNVDRAVHNTYKDELLKETCSKTRAESVTIFGIAFTAPAEGQAAISNCASLPTSEHYFFIDEAQTDEEIAEELNTAFQLIAAEVGSLRLTQ
ncbi:MAG: hypothetical protein HC844_10090 [Tabrizicola sp.]|nr:hypothetical protein [Tabrizicola sp.]